MNNFLVTSIDDMHLAEFQASAIAEDITALNFQSWNPENENDLDVVFLLLVSAPEHRNNGTLAGHANQQLANTLRSGGWKFGGYKGISVKPNVPRSNSEGKVIKYESPRGVGNQQIFIPRVSVRVGYMIATKIGKDAGIEYAKRTELRSPESEDTGFWEWFLSKDFPLIITEGAKKAAAMISAGYATIALNGVWGWGNNVKDMFGEIEKDDRGENLKTLHPDLEQFLNGREIVLAFDRDEKIITLKYVEAAKKRFCQEIEGEADRITEIKWRGHKGIDDYIAAKGVKALDNAYAKRSVIKLLPPPKAETVTNYRFNSSIEDGLVKVVADGNKELRAQIGNHLAAIACVDNLDRDGAALLLEFKTFKGDIRRWTMLRAYLAGDGSAIVEGLLSRGYDFERKQKPSLLDYIQRLGADVEKSYTVTDSSGWYQKNFVTPHKTYGDENLKFRDVEPSSEAITEITGTLEDWIDLVASKCAGNSRAILALGTSFAATLLHLVGIESGGFHFVGPTSKGKTTLLSISASVTGVKKIPHWRATSNGIEGIAAVFNHLCLLLDEIAQADPRDVGNIIYMIGNGQGKTRMKRDLTSRKTKEWLLIVLSSGEVEIASYMKQANITQKGGQEVRLIDVPALPEGAKYGCFETIHGADNAVQFVSELDAAVKEHHGTALDAFLSLLVVDTADLPFTVNLSKQVHVFATKLSEGTVDSAVGRVAKRFALVQVALELAHKYGLLPFPIEQIDWAISTIFKDWLNARGGDGSIEIKQAIAHIEHLLDTNELSDRVHDLRDGDDKIVRNLLAYRKVDREGDTEEFWVPPSVFEREFCNGVNNWSLD